MKRRINTKKILVAAIGVASVSYALGCLESESSSGNLLPPVDGSVTDGKADTNVTSGNLMPPPDTGAVDTGSDISSSGNLMPPEDAGDSGDPGDAADGGG